MIELILPGGECAAPCDSYPEKETMKITGETTINQLAIELGKLGVERTQLTIAGPHDTEAKPGERLVHMLTAQGWMITAFGPTEAEAFNAALEVIRAKIADELSKGPEPS